MNKIKGFMQYMQQTERRDGVKRRPPVLQVGRLYPLGFDLFGIHSIVLCWLLQQCAIHIISIFFLHSDLVEITMALGQDRLDSSFTTIQIYATLGTSLVVQWLKLCAPSAGGLGLISGWRLDSACMLQLSPYPTTKVCTPQLNIPYTTTKTQCSQNKINTFKTHQICPTLKKLLATRVTDPYL